MGASVSNEQCSETNFAMSSLEMNVLKWIPVICFAVMWTIHKLMVSKFEMKPIIKMTQDLSPSTTDGLFDDLVKKRELLALVISKRLDEDNQFRIRRRGSIEFVKSGMLFGGFMLFVWMLWSSPSFYYDVYIRYNVCCVNYFYLKVNALVCGSIYLWEIVMLEQYFNNHWSVYVHHWLVVFAGARVAAGFFSPFIINHAISIALQFVSVFINGFRFNYCEIYPNLTRFLCKVKFVYMTSLTCVALFLDAMIFIRLSIIGFSETTITLPSAVIGIVCLIGWSYDDVKLLKYVWGWTKLPYEELQFTKSTVDKPQIPLTPVSSASATYDPGFNHHLAVPSATYTSRASSIMEMEVHVDTPTPPPQTPISP
eukprot:11785_1